MYHNTLKNPLKKNRKRVGRGIAAGQGKTAGRGHKGQKSRTGKKLKIIFEGGQTPLFMKLPRIRGFKNPNNIKYQTINVGDLEKAGLSDINNETLKKAGLIKRNLPVKILGTGEISKKLNVEIDAISLAAKEKIEKAGGKVQVKQVKKEVVETSVKEKSPEPSKKEEVKEDEKKDK